MLVDGPPGPRQHRTASPPAHLRVGAQHTRVPDTAKQRVAQASGHGGASHRSRRVRRTVQAHIIRTERVRAALRARARHNIRLEEAPVAHASAAVHAPELAQRRRVVRARALCDAVEAVRVRTTQLARVIYTLKARVAVAVGDRGRAQASRGKQWAPRLRVLVGAEVVLLAEHALGGDAEVRWHAHARHDERGPRRRARVHKLPRGG